MKTECDYLYGWLKNSHMRKNLTKKMVNSRDIAWNAEEEEVSVRLSVN